MDELWAQVVARFGERAWRPGMRVWTGRLSGHIWVQGGFRDGSFDVGGARWTPQPGQLPDFDHDGTRGCLLGLVRELWGDPTLTTDHIAMADGPGWTIYHPDLGVFGPMPTEGEALLRAILAAPEGAMKRNQESL